MAAREGAHCLDAGAAGATVSSGLPRNGKAPEPASAPKSDADVAARVFGDRGHVSEERLAAAWRRHKRRPDRPRRRRARSSR
jgi:hypothetical protein